ncbi:MAG: RNase H family protein [Aeromonas sp.]
MLQIIGRLTNSCIFRSGTTEKGFVTRVSDRLQGKQSAQRADMIAVTEALKFTGTNRVNIFSDYGYAVTAVHVNCQFGSIVVLLPHQVDLLHMHVKPETFWRL